MSQERLWTEIRGAGDPLLVLLHGLNATAAVWEPLDAVFATSWPGRRMLIDLPGHGRSDPLAEYSFGIIAAEVARAIGSPIAPVVIVGHSMGGAVGLALASGGFGVPVARVLAIGVKVAWTAEELEAAERTRNRQVKWYDSHQEAEQRFLKVAGIPEDAAADPNLLAGGVRAVGGRFRVAADPRAASIGGPPMERFMAAAAAPVRLACGELDPMVDVGHLRRFDPEAVVIPGCGHNAHIENPAAIARVLMNDTLRFVSV